MERFALERGDPAVARQRNIARRTLLDGHWDAMKAQRRTARREKRRFAVPLYPQVLEAHRMLALHRLVQAADDWRSLTNEQIAEVMKRAGLLTYSGQPFTPTHARDLRRSLLRAEAADAQRIEEKHRRILQRIIRLEAALADSWDAHVDREAMALVLEVFRADRLPKNIREAAHALEAKLHACRRRAQTKLDVEGVDIVK